MYILDTANKFGGTMEKTKSSKFVVNLWYIPGGYDYSNAKLVNVFFDDKENATKFERVYAYPPEMSILGTIEDFMKSSKKQNA